GDPAGAVGDDDELDDHQDQEDHQADDHRPADDHVAERLDDLAGVAVEQHEPDRADVQGQPEHGGDEEEGGEDGEVERLLDVHARQEDEHGAGEVQHQEEVEDDGGQRHHHHHDHAHDGGRNSDLTQSVRPHRTSPQARPVHGNSRPPSWGHALI